jgi:steroid delta-isomerase-like uncharacterized protein
MTDSEKDLGRRWFEEIWNKGRRETIAEMLAPDGVIHDGGTQSRGPEGFYPFFDRIHASFSDMHVKVEDTFAEGDKICIRWSCTATHTGSGLGFDPTGRTINITGITIARISAGRFVEAWQNWDMLGMTEQLQGPRTAATYIGTR